MRLDPRLALRAPGDDGKKCNALSLPRSFLFDVIQSLNREALFNSRRLVTCRQALRAEPPKAPVGRAFQQCKLVNLR